MAGVNLFNLFLQVISGQHFPKPKGSGSRGDVTDPYVTIEIFGIPADCAEERTKTVPHNGKLLGIGFKFVMPAGLKLSVEMLL